jgi:hypothetical protein
MFSAYTHLDSALRKKLDDEAWKGNYVGCSLDSCLTNVQSIYWQDYSKHEGGIRRRGFIDDFTYAPLLVDYTTPLMRRC